MIAVAVLAAALARKAAQPPQMMLGAFPLPLAHAGHYIWTLYIPPVLIVVFSIVKTTLSERRKAREEEEAAGEGPKKGPKQG
jgi:hypothetical protein